MVFEFRRMFDFRLSGLFAFAALNYYPLRMVFSFLHMLGVDIFIGFFTTSFTLIAGLACARKVGFAHVMDSLFAAYVCYLLVGIVPYINGRMPISLYFTAVQSSLLPMLFYYIGRSEWSWDVFYRRTIIGLMFCFVVGLYLYFVSPQWYVDWKIRGLESWLMENTQTYVEEKGHFTSFFLHSYFTGYMSFVSFAILAGRLVFGRFSVANMLGLIMSIIVIFLSQQRVSVVAFVILVACYQVYFVLVRSRLALFAFFCEILVIYLALHFDVSKVDFLSVVYERIFDSTFSGAVSERSHQWILLLSMQTNYIFGHGLGCAGNAAFSIGLPAVCDGEIFKHYYETGFVGVFLLALILGVTVLRAMRHLQHFYIELSIVLFFIMSIFVANSLSNMTEAVTIFWFAVGRIWSEVLPAVNLHAREGGA